MVFVASCLFGLEKLVAEDIDALGYKRLETMDGRVCFEAPLEAVARCNIFFRYAERLFIKLGDFEATSFDSLFEQVKALPFEEYIGEKDQFPVKGHSIRSKLFSIPDCQRIIKKAIVERLKQKYGGEHFEESGVKYQVEFFIFNDRVSIMIDTSGVGLHKRGYRLQANDAPLRETLAAAMVRLSRPRPGVLTVDPLCGSGTIAIEAALMVTDTAPGLKRSFAGESFSWVPKRFWDEARAEALAKIKPCETPIYGFDIDPACIEIARANAERAGVSDLIIFEVEDVRRFKSPIPDARGTIVTNPPYGERMGEKTETEALFKAMGKSFCENVPKWQIYVLNCNEEFERFFGRRADKVRKLYNGMIKCSFFQFFKNK